MITLEELKARIKAGQPVAGEQFTNAKGSVGTVLPSSSSHGKLEAEMTCTETGCTNTHHREVSDWHQCHKCKTHSKKRGGKAKLSQEAKAQLDKDKEEARKNKLAETQEQIKNLAEKYGVKTDEA